MDVCYRLPNWENKMDEAFYERVGADSYSQNMISEGGLQPPQYLLEGQHGSATEIKEVSGICW